MDRRIVYKVKLDIFEGPFDLLVYLIESAKMSIYDIQVAEITKQYIEYVEEIKYIDGALAGEFMVLAASLIEIKSRMLLPRRVSEEGIEYEEDPRDELVQRILEYKKYKAAAEMLEEAEEEMQLIHFKPKEDISVYTDAPDIYLNLELTAFIRAFHIFLRRKKKLEDVHKKYGMERRQQMSIESRIEQIKSLLFKRRKLNFNELLEGKGDRQTIVVTFLSMLELIRQKAVSFNQNINFGEIIFTMNKSKSKTENKIESELEREK